MRVNILCVGICAVLNMFFVGAAPADAALHIFRGTFVSYKSGTLTTMDKNGQKESFSVSKSTLVMSRDGDNNQLERVRPGTKLSIMMDGSSARTVTILEVPK